MDIESKINLINMLKEERLIERDEMRWGVKPLWKGNNITQFSQMREQLTIKSNARLLNQSKEI
jgi:hypothetical protein